MQTLLYLWFLKTKATIRNLFKKPSSAIFTGLMVLLYGFIFAMLLTKGGQQSGMVVTIDLHSSILVIIAFLALMLFSTMMSSKKALFYGEDAFYLFGGPFTRKQIMAYLTFQTIVQSFMFGLIALFIFASMSSAVVFNPVFSIILFLCSSLSIIIFMVLTDYLYILSIGDQKYRILSKVIVGGFIILIVGVFIGTYLQTGNLKTLMVDFIQSSLFYFVPVFGWLKLALIGYITNKTMMFIGIALLILGCFVVYLLFIHYKGDFYEQALEDSLDFSRRYKSLKEGNQNAMKDTKVKEVKGHFQDGALAVMSKNFLLMKKTGHIVSISDLVSIGIYIGISILSGLGFAFFVYMLIFWIFSSLQKSELSIELKNYQIYLIPDKPIKKLIAVMIPTFIKVTAVTTLSLVIVGLYYGTDILTLMMYIINMIGYICVFMSASVLTVRILKSRSSQLFENLMKMFIMVVAALPSVLLSVYMMITGSFQFNSLSMVSYLSLIMNFVITIIILFACQNMMNGRELKSE